MIELPDDSDVDVKDEGTPVPVPEHLKLTPEEERLRRGWADDVSARFAAAQSLPNSYLQGATLRSTHEDVLTWAGSGQCWRAKVALAGGADPNGCDRHGATPLHFAVINGTPSVVKVLLQSGANPLTKEVEGRTPIGMVMQKNNVELLEIIKAYAKDKQSLREFIASVPSDETRLNQLLAAAEAARLQGSFQDSERLFRDAISEAERFGTLWPHVAHTTKELADFLEELGRDAEADGLYARYREIMYTVPFEGGPEYADFLLNRARKFLRQGNHAESKEFAYQALHHRGYHDEINRDNLEFCEQVAQVRENSANAEQCAKTFNETADIYLNLGQLDKAEELYLKAIAAFKQDIAESYNFLSSFQSLAGIYQTLQQPIRAQQMHDEYARQKVLLYGSSGWGAN